MFALRTCANIVSFLLVTKSEIGAERVPIWEASGKCSEKWDFCGFLTGSPQEPTETHRRPPQSTTYQPLPNAPY